MRRKATSIPVTAPRRPTGRPRRKPIPPEGLSAYEQRVAADLAIKGAILLMELDQYLASPECAVHRGPVLIRPGPTTPQVTDMVYLRELEEEFGRKPSVFDRPRHEREGFVEHANRQRETL